MDVIYSALAGLVILSTVVPFLPLQHWTVRWFDFAKVHFLVLGLLTFAFGWKLPEWSREIQILQGLLALSVLYDCAVLVRYTPLYRVKPIDILEDHSDSMVVLSANVLQFNTRYDAFIDAVRQSQPDVVLTMESNEAWETALKAIEEDYPYHCKVPLENTYGMHLYSKLQMDAKVHFFVADDIPSIEAEIRSRRGYKFTLFCVHPPPPSPTEESNSKERDGELLSVAKKIREDGKTTVVVGDFNNVAWARSSVLFRKMSQTIDPRVGRGLYSTFHAKYWFARFPIDQLYHTPAIFIQELGALGYNGSDHFPLFCKFYVNRHDDSQEELTEDLEEGESEEVEELIEAGIEEESDREEVASE